MLLLRVKNNKTLQVSKTCEVLFIERATIPSWEFFLPLADSATASWLNLKEAGGGLIFYRLPLAGVLVAIRSKFP